jgi:lipoate-protein ligase A
VLHHGTLLFNADRTCCTKPSGPGVAIRISRAIEPQPRMNVSELLPGLSLDDFRMTWIKHFLLNYKGNVCVFSPQEEKSIQELAISKYRTWEWVYGWSPDYEFNGEWRPGKIQVTIWLKVHRGMITDCRLISDDVPAHLLNNLTGLMKGLPHEENSLLEAVNKSDVLRDLKHVGPMDLVNAFF